MTKEQGIVPEDTILQMRALLPKRRMTYGEARIVAQQQALRVRNLLSITRARLPLDWVEHIPGVSVQMLGAYEVEDLTRVPGASGATKIKRDGTYEVSLNRNTSVTHCRFTLAHE